MSDSVENSKKNTSKRIGTSIERWNRLSVTRKTFAIIFPISMIIIYYGVLYETGIFEKPFVFNNDMTLHDQGNRSLGFHVDVEMTAKLFAVASPIHVQAWVQPLQPDPYNVVYVVFDHSHNIPHTLIGFGDTMYGGQINATQIHNSNSYYGETNLDYDMEGCYPIKIVSVPQTPVNFSPFNGTEPCLIHISSSEATSVITTNTLLVGLAIVQTATSALVIVTVIRDVRLDKVHDKHEPNDTSKSHRTKNNNR